MEFVVSTLWKNYWYPFVMVLVSIIVKNFLAVSFVYYYPDEDQIIYWCCLISLKSLNFPWKFTCFHCLEWLNSVNIIALCLLFHWVVQGTQLISNTDNVGLIINSIERIQKCGNVEQVVSFEISSSKEQIEYRKLVLGAIGQLTVFFSRNWIKKLRYLAIELWMV